MPIGNGLRLTTSTIPDMGWKQLNLIKNVKIYNFNHLHVIVYRFVRLICNVLCNYWTEVVVVVCLCNHFQLNDDPIRLDRPGFLLELLEHCYLMP